ncbi:MAG: DUF494 family protein [Candidatus Hydrogenedentes bacterium]|nr:DUF494 family protein [Candidatus Hydrogenedentota bacterium]
MKAPLNELVNEILQRLEEHPERAPSESGIRSWLVRQGYNQRDIDAAMRIMRPRFASARPLTSRGPAAVRQLSPYEEYKLAPEARDALARLELYELIDPFEREMILERLNQFDGEVGLEELDYLLSWLLYSTRDVETQQTIYNVFEGNRDTLH